MTLDVDGVYAFVLVRDVDFFMIEQFEISTGRWINRTSINHFASSIQSITATDNQGETWLTDVQRLNLDHVHTDIDGAVQSVV